MKHTETGTVHLVEDTKEYGAKGFKKRVFILKTGSEKWPQFVPFELTKEATDNPPTVGAKVAVDFYLEGREWQGRYIASNKCAGFEYEGGVKPSPVKPPASAAPAAQPAVDANGDDQIPF